MKAKRITIERREVTTAFLVVPADSKAVFCPFCDGYKGIEVTETGRRCDFCGAAVVDILDLPEVPKASLKVDPR